MLNKSRKVQIEKVHLEDGLLYKYGAVNKEVGEASERL